MITKVTSDLTQKAPFHPELKPIRELKTTTKPYYVKALYVSTVGGHTLLPNSHCTQQYIM